MKKNIRKAVFETNSSSTHSVHIDNETILLDTSLVPNEEGELYFYGNDYGWEVESYNDAHSKIDYVSLLINPEQEKMLVDVIKEQTGAKEVNFKKEGYVDHGSEHGIVGEAFTDKETLRNYIFNMNSFLFTTNDNCSTCWMITEEGEAKTYESGW
jgi:hypothetical protein